MIHAFLCPMRNSPARIFLNSQQAHKALHKAIFMKFSARFFIESEEKFLKIFLTPNRFVWFL